MTFKDQVRRIALASPSLHLFAQRARARIALTADRLAGNKRLIGALAERDALDRQLRELRGELDRVGSERDALELELYGLRSDLFRAAARAEAERELRMEAEAHLASILART
jgi:septal ring factor EnvC (AmiA/AmiB activator)